jgi:hypothetical protein
MMGRRSTGFAAAPDAGAMPAQFQRNTSPISGSRYQRGRLRNSGVIAINPMIGPGSNNHATRTSSV